MKRERAKQVPKGQGYFAKVLKARGLRNLSVRVTQRELDVATKLGNGSISDGMRRALNIAGAIPGLVDTPVERPLFTQVAEFTDAVLERVSQLEDVESAFHQFTQKVIDHGPDVDPDPA